MLLPSCLFNRFHKKHTISPSSIGLFFDVNSPRLLLRSKKYTFLGSLLPKMYIYVYFIQKNTQKKDKPLHHNQDTEQMKGLFIYMIIIIFILLDSIFCCCWWWWLFKHTNNHYYLWIRANRPHLSKLFIFFTPTLGYEYKPGTQEPEKTYCSHDFHTKWQAERLHFGIERKKQVVSLWIFIKNVCLRTPFKWKPLSNPRPLMKR